MLILEADDLEELEKILQSLPIVQAGYATFEIIRLDPYTGLDRLKNLS